ncbi:MAG: VWA domain-containing protein, partial [Phycisphaerae bacterium]|nr:VWA domain-containing protein [Saprospiraceae bacterium]
METKSLSLNYALDNQYFLRNGPNKDVYLYLSLTGGPSPKQSQRPPLNLALVLDRSGSMSGEKLAYAKKAVSFVVNHLSPTDTLSIVHYDDQVEVVQKAAPVSDKTFLHQKVDRIAAGGSTNLSGGMLEGYNQVNSVKQPKYVNRVLLLSDGLANVGVTEPQELQQLAQRQFRQEQLSLSTFGVGADFNEDLMTNLAEYGAGNYFFIASPDQIPAIFAKELAGLLSVVAQGVQVEVTFPDTYLTCSRVDGYPYVVEEDRVVIKLGDIFSQQEKGMLLKFDCDQPFERDIAFGISLTYSDATAQLSPVKERHQLPLQVTESEETWRSG